MAFDLRCGHSHIGTCCTGRYCKLVSVVCLDQPSDLSLVGFVCRSRRQVGTASGSREPSGRAAVEPARKGTSALAARQEPERRRPVSCRRGSSNSINMASKARGSATAINIVFATSAVGASSAKSAGAEVGTPVE